jgi:hypothetical protein
VRPRQEQAWRFAYFDVFLMFDHSDIKGGLILAARLLLAALFFNFSVGEN